MKRIEAFLTEFDSETSAEEQVHVVTLANADAEEVQSLVRAAWLRKAPKRFALEMIAQGRV